MALDINYGRLGNSQSIKGNVERNVERVLRVANDGNDISAQLWIDMDVDRNEVDKKHFKIAMEIYRFGEKRVFVEKSGEDFFSCLKKTLDVARVFLVNNC